MSEHLFYGGEIDHEGIFVEHPLPHISDGFILVLNSANWPIRDQIIRRIFETVSPSFKPFCPGFDSTLPPEAARLEYAEQLNKLFKNNGMAQVKVRIEKGGE